MKKILLICCLGLLITSCKKDNENAGTDNSLASIVIGKWFITDLDVDVSIDVLGALDTDVESVSGFYNFKSNNDFDYEIDADMNVTFPGVGELPFPYAVQGNGTYKILSEEQIELTENGEVSIVDIISANHSIIVATMESVMDTMGFQLEMEIDIVMEK